MAPEILYHAQSVAVELKTEPAFPGLSKLPLLSSQETAEQWLKYEQLIYSCLITGDDKSASLCLERLEQRFGASNEKVRSLRGLYEEATATGRQTEDILHHYEKVLAEYPENIPLAKRRITLLKSMGKDAETITALGKLLDMSPTDIEAWAELAELYVDQRMYAQAIYCLEEVLLIQPNAWNIHARICEVSNLSVAKGEEKPVMAERLLSAMRHACRSVELCKEYVRGYCGLKKSTSRLLALEQASPGLMEEAYITAANRLHEQATAELRTIVQAYPALCEAPEILAAKAMLE